MTSRSKSRSARAKDNNRSKQLTQKPNSISGAQEEVEPGEKEELFMGNHPWVISSPHARVKALGPTEQPQVPTMEEAAPAGSSVEKTAATSDQNDHEVLTHLRGLKKAMGSLPEAMEAQLSLLEAKTDKTLTHGHINKLGKLQRQLATLNTKISEMDHNWKVFTEKVMQKFVHHQQMYQQCREKLIQEYLQKSQEIQAAKEQVQSASVALLQTPMAEPPASVEPLDAEALFEGAVQDDAYMNMEEDGEEDQEQEAELVRDKTRPAIAPFRRTKPISASPTKVHAVHLKK